MTQSNLQVLLLGEFRQILESLIHSRALFDEGLKYITEGKQISEEMLRSYMLIKRKKMNTSMMVLIDSISLEREIDDSLIDFIDKMGHICELRAVVYKDL